MNHNHITRDIKRKGECPGCDEYHNRKIKRKVAEKRVKRVLNNLKMAIDSNDFAFENNLVEYHAHNQKELKEAYKLIKDLSK